MAHKVTKYIVGKTLPDEPYVFGVALVPENQMQPIECWEGSANLAGARFPPKELLTEEWKEHFRLAHAEWFWPFLVRMANGEVVKLSEVQDTYIALFGKEMCSVEGC